MSQRAKNKVQRKWKRQKRNQKNRKNILKKMPVEQVGNVGVQPVLSVQARTAKKLRSRQKAKCYYDNSILNQRVKTLERKVT